MAVVDNKPDVQHYWPAASVPAKYDVLWYFRRQRGFRREPGDPPNIQLGYAGWVSRGYVSKRPLEAWSETYAIGVNTGWWLNRWVQAPFGQDFAPVVNKSWDKLMSRVKGDTSSLAVAAAEGRETFEMVAKRVTGLYRAYRSLRKGDFRQFLRELSVDPKRKHRSLVRSAANEASGLWLEYWFGWSPTIQDIYSGALALSSNPVIHRVREHGSAMMSLPPKSNGGASGRARWNSTNRTGKCFVKQGATFELENYNLFLASRLGLVNPALVAWELVPFSFVIDWFTKFGGYLEGFTDLAGLSVHDAYTTSRIHLPGAVTTYSTRDRAASELIVDYVQDGHIRKTSLSKPIPVVPRLLNFGNSKTRAATAVSLLTTIFLDGSPSRR